MSVTSWLSHRTLCIVTLASLVVQLVALATLVTSSSSAPPTNYVIDSIECHARSSCHGQPNEDDLDEENIHLTADDRNCRCDDKCRLYDDCCHDYQAPTTNDTASLRAVANCLSLPEVDPTASIYIVNRCPDVRLADEVTKRRCEVGVRTVDGFQLNRLPVMGSDTEALYRNAFCAACNGERDRKFVYWVARVTLCASNVPAVDDIHRANISDLLTTSVDAGCQVTFHPDHVSAKYRLTGSADDVDKSSSPMSSTRRCRPRVLGKCDRNWLNRSTGRMCRDGPTGHVYAGLRTFRNRYCAVCNHVNETYLRCTPDNQTRNGNEDADRYSASVDDTEPYIVVDMNDKKAVLHSTSLDNPDEDDEDYDEDDENDLPTFQFPVCTDVKELYDPFSGQCVRPPSTCRPGSTLVGGRCENDHDRTDSDDDVTKVFVRSAANERDDEDGDVIDDVKFPSTISITEYRFSVGDSSTNSNSSSSVATTVTPRSALSSRPFSLSMFRLGDLERLASIVGTLIGAVAYVAALLGACAFRRRGPLDHGNYCCDTAARCFMCLMVCLFLRHVGYLAIVTGVSMQDYVNPTTDPSTTVPPTGRVCFYASVGLQYFSLAAFFWLNVLTVEVYRRLSSSSLKWLIHPSVDFVFYSLYAWTLPALAVGWSIAVELLGVDAWTPRGMYASTDDASSTEPPFGNLPRRPTDCWVVGFIQLLLFVLPAFLTTVVDVVLLVVTGCRKCFREDDGGDEEDEIVGKSSSKKLAPVDDNLPHPWRRNIPDKQLDDDGDFEKSGESNSARSRRQRAENLYVCCVQLTLLMSMTWALCFLASTLPGAPHPLLWYLYILFDVALAVTASLAFLTTEHRIWLRLTTRRHRWNRVLSDDGTTHKLPRRATGPGDVIVVEGMAGWTTSGSTTVSTSAAAGPDSPLSIVVPTGEETDTTTERKDDDSLKLLMRETSI